MDTYSEVPEIEHENEKAGITATFEEDGGAAMAILRITDTRMTNHMIDIEAGHVTARCDSFMFDSDEVRELATTLEAIADQMDEFDEQE